jgi:multiple sugar transport system substrate-binding protein
MLCLVVFAVAPAQPRQLMTLQQRWTEPQVVVCKIMQGRRCITATAAKPQADRRNPGGAGGADEAFAAIAKASVEEYPDIRKNRSNDPRAVLQQGCFAAALAAGGGAPDISMIEINDVGDLLCKAAFDVLCHTTMPENMKGLCLISGSGLDPRRKAAGVSWISVPQAFSRRDLFAAAGLPTEPEEVAKLLSTWQGYLDTGKLVNDPANNVFWTDNISNIPYIYFAHKNFFDENLNIAFNNPRTLELFKYALAGRQANLDARIPAWTQEWYNALGAGQIATTIAGSWFGGFLKSWVDPEGIGQWGVVPIPEDPLQNWGGSFLAITEQSKNKEAAWAFIEYAMTNADAQNRMFIK